MPDNTPPFRTLVSIVDRDGRPTRQFTRWIETLVDNLDSSADTAESNAEEQFAPVSAPAQARTITLSPVMADTPTMEALSPV